ncbi:MAG: hypothetical protein PHO28_00015 [Candidatus Pacebacteria bacterium]|nr:hypothetical protein [Candidatus Paceibacterota bacterium]
MPEKFDLISNLPLIILSFLFLIIFILFIIGGVILLRAKGDYNKIEKGRRFLSSAFFSFFSLILIILVFYSVSYFIQKGKILEPQPAYSEFPVSPAVGFPPAPKFLEIKGYYFNGPYPIKEANIINYPAIYIILCKKPDRYESVFIKQSGGNESIPKNQDYNNWIQKCGGKTNTYIAVFWGNEKYYPSEKLNEILNDINK